MMPRPKLFRTVSRRRITKARAHPPCRLSMAAQKRRAASTYFGSRPKKPKGTAAATKRDEAAAKADRFRKVVKQPQVVSA